MSNKQTYRFTRGYSQWMTGEAVELTEDEAQQLNNEAPGALERVGPAPKDDQPRAKPTVKEDI